MALEAKLLQKLSQNLLMTPQLQQAIQMLQMGRDEFQEEVEKQLLENPILEELKEGGRETPSSFENNEAQESFSSSNTAENSSAENEGSEPLVDSQSDWEGYLESFTDSRGAASPKGLVDFEDKPSVEATLTRTETLVEHLSDQIRLLDISDSEKVILSHIIGNLNRDGYLCVSYDEIAAASESTVLEVERMIDHVKSFDPVGIAARDLKECLYFQLERQGKHEGLAGRIVLNHLELIEKRKFDQIAKAEKVSVQEIYSSLQIIQQLDPRPARAFADDSVRYVVPDIYVQKVGREYVITLNEDGLPKLRVSPYYMTLLQNGEAGTNGSKTYLQERLKAASWLIKSIHQRQQTIYKVTESIVKFQREFFDQGIEKLKPLVLKDVADDIGMHESTVSRVTSNKYVHTPQGVFELKYFFTSGIKSSSGDVSSSAVKERIRNLVAAESSDSPISDQQIVELLKQENLDIARRTVAKYRESLGIPSSSRRKKLF